MKIKISDLKRVIKEVVSESIAAPTQTWKLQPDPRNYQIEFLMGDDVVIVEVRRDVWTTPIDPTVGYNGDWEAEVAGAHIYDEAADEERWVTGDEFLLMLTPDQTVELEDAVEKVIFAPAEV